MSKRPKHICNTCIHFGVRTCCDKAVCAEQNWDDTEDDGTYGSIENFLWEMIPDNQCDDWRDQEMKPKQKWIKGMPVDDGWYWIYTGTERLVVIIKGDKLFLRENDMPPLGYPLSLYEDACELWFMPCDVPEPPQ